ncbi:MAG: hypothetical protein ACP5P4_11905 [Steroidobacteraceae bacterium]
MEISALVVHGTPDLVLSAGGRAIGKLGYTNIGTKGWPRHHIIGGIVVHSSLTVTKEGLSLGLSAIKGRLSSSFGEWQEAGRISGRYRASPLPDNAAATMSSTKRARTLAIPSVQVICAASIHNGSEDGV